jgi:hypothetical protein
VRFLTQRPAVASPFGVEGGAGSMEDVAGFFVAREESVAESILARRRARWVLLSPPERAIADATLFLDATRTSEGAAPLPPATGDPSAPWAMVAARLYHVAGSATPITKALGGFRLVSESSAPAGAAPFRLFERVPGARVSIVGARPGAMIVARTWLHVRGRAVEWRDEARADGVGTAAVRLPYATGANGTILASAWTFSDGVRFQVAAIGEELVSGGGRAEVRLAGASTAGRGR